MKTVPIEEAIAMVPNGASLMIGGFMGCGTPEPLMDELLRQGKRELTVIANDTARPGAGIGKLVHAKLVRSVIASHIGLNPETQEQMIAGELEVQLVPQGTLVERIRAGGAGLGGVLTPTGLGTVVEEGKQKICANGHQYLLETALRADYALVHALICDYLGNLAYALTAQLQPADGDSRRYGHCLCGPPRAARRHRAGPCHHSRSASRLRHCEGMN